MFNRTLTVTVCFIVVHETPSLVWNYHNRWHTRGVPAEAEIRRNIV